MSKSGFISNKLLREKTRTVLVRNIKCEEDIRKLFGDFKLGEFKIVRLDDSDESFHVIFRGEHSASRAVARFHGQLINGRELLKVERLELDSTDKEDLAIRESKAPSCNSNVRTTSPVRKFESRPIARSKSPAVKRSHSTIRRINFSSILPPPPVPAVRATSPCSQITHDAVVTEGISTYQREAMDLVLLLGKLQGTLDSTNTAQTAVMNDIIKHTMSIATGLSGLSQYVSVKSANNCSGGSQHSASAEGINNNNNNHGSNDRSSAHNSTSSNSNTDSGFNIRMSPTTIPLPPTAVAHTSPDGHEMTLSEAATLLSESSIARKNRNRRLKASAPPLTINVLATLPGNNTEGSIPKRVQIEEQSVISALSGTSTVVLR